MNSHTKNVIENEMCFVNVWPKELLVKMFKFMDFKDRISVERVSTLWRYLARELAWTDVQSFNMDSFAGKGNLYNEIFQRCGKYLKSVTLCEPLENYGIDHFELFPLFGALQHLEIINESTPEMVGNIARRFPELRSLILQSPTSNVLPELKTILSKCKSLEYFHDGFKYISPEEITYFPRTLKIISVDQPRGFYLNCLDSLNLSALIYKSCIFIDEILSHKAFFNRLKFLRVFGFEFPQNDLPEISAFNEFVHLEALQMGNFPIRDEEWRMLLTKLRSLKHLHLKINDKNRKIKLGVLKKLRSCCIALEYYNVKPRNTVISALHGCAKLEYLEVSPILDFEIAELSQIVEHCPNLNTIVCGFNFSEFNGDFDVLGKVLDKLHINDIAPSASDNSRILHIHLNSGNKIARPEWLHPWARVHFADEVPLPRSKVLRKLIGQCVSKPIPEFLMELVNLNEDWTL